MKKRTKYFDDGYALVFVYVDSSSGDHPSPCFKVWNGKINIVCSHM
jgi:hypothetical protein